MVTNKRSLDYKTRNITVGYSNDEFDLYVYESMNSDCNNLSILGIVFAQKFDLIRIFWLVKYGN